MRLILQKQYPYHVFLMYQEKTLTIKECGKSSYECVGNQVKSLRSENTVIKFLHLQLQINNSHIKLRARFEILSMRCTGTHKPHQPPSSQ